MKIELQHHQRVLSFLLRKDIKLSLRVVQDKRLISVMILMFNKELK